MTQSCRFAEAERFMFESQSIDRYESRFSAKHRDRIIMLIDNKIAGDVVHWRV